jgi:hypothetical protein
MNIKLTYNLLMIYFGSNYLGITFDSLIIHLLFTDTLLMMTSITYNLLVFYL